ncbi:uncharacterized protein LOC108477317 [Gossypium arboreum]|uniref:uncharacterized protein LOC108477317 n=1 Tax=Gossypium arboreum TaxID=29729 RepID=UPI0022F1DA31|nr:uncharacterized protein LOC108477317 [Gossypium arboreum]
MGRGQRAPGRGASHTKARQPALVYAVHHREDRDVQYVITENPTSEVIVLSPLGQSVRVNKLFGNIPLEVQRIIFLADLMELFFGEFDLILGMDWLVKHQVNLYCAIKWMVLKIAKGDVEIVIGECRNYLSNVISALRAEKLVRKGCEAYLAYIGISDSKGSSSVTDIRTVKDFPDVFPDELPRLPPNCEVEFRIELLPSTAPPEFGKEFTVYNDASHVGLVCVLMREDKMVAYGSRQLKTHEVKAEHQLFSRLLQPVKIPLWK